MHTPTPLSKRRALLRDPNNKVFQIKTISTNLLNSHEVAPHDMYTGKQLNVP